MGIVCDLEDDLISPDLWRKLYDIMPKECQKAIDDKEYAIGIGINPKYGWFIMGSGQGPCLLWAEKDSPSEE